MKYIIRERDFHYIPEPKDADLTFDSVICTKEIETEVDTINKALEKCMAFAEVFHGVEAVEWFEDCIITLVSNLDSDNPKHKEYFFTQRHQLDVFIDK